MTNFELALGSRLTKNEMKEITGGKQAYCIFCDDGDIHNMPCGNDPDCSMFASWMYENGEVDGYSCSDGQGGGDMSICPL